MSLLPPSTQGAKQSKARCQTKIPAIATEGLKPPAVSTPPPSRIPRLSASKALPCSSIINILYVSRSREKNKLLASCDQNAFCHFLLLLQKMMT
jgi:hypothetical protein